MQHSCYFDLSIIGFLQCDQFFSTYWNFKSTIQYSSFNLYQDQADLGCIKLERDPPLEGGGDAFCCVNPAEVMERPPRLPSLWAARDASWEEGETNWREVPQQRLHHQQGEEEDDLDIDYNILL